MRCRVPGNIREKCDCIGNKSRNCEENSARESDEAVKHVIIWHALLAESFLHVTEYVTTLRFCEAEPEDEAREKSKKRIDETDPRTDFKNRVDLEDRIENKK